MSLAVVYSRASLGIAAPQVTVEVHLSNGLPAFNMVGLPETSVKESRDRVRSALLNGNFEFPAKHITVNLAPADLPKEGGRFDLAIAIGILAASKQIPAKYLLDHEFLGELALTGEIRPVLGVLPYLHGLYLDAEDALPRKKEAKGDTRLKVIAPAYPRISNHNDLDPLRFHPDVDFTVVGPHDAVPPCDLIVLPGSKAVQADLHWLREMGWEEAIRRHLRYGGKLIGICGGYQMLGRRLHDPLGLEGAAGSVDGLALLDVETTLEAEKQLVNVHGTLALAGNAPVAGYEIHMGVTHGPALARPVAHLADGRPDGALSADGQILGSYLHGLFDQPEALAALLAWAGLHGAAAVDLTARRETDLDRLADSLETHLDLARLAACFGPGAAFDALTTAAGLLDRSPAPL